MKLAGIVSQSKILTQQQLEADPELLKEIQSVLALADLYPLNEIDGIWGPKIERAIAQFCDRVHINSSNTGLFGSSFAQALIDEAKKGNKFLTESDYQEAASFLNCKVAAIKAVVEVECAGRGFFASGKPKILFEAHIFDRLTGGKFRQSHPNLSSKNWNRSLYSGGPAEYNRLEKAMQLNKDAALQSASWGLGQVMGMNYRVCGYANVKSMVDEQYISEGKQLITMCRFIKGNKLDGHLRQGNWKSFARGYNGNQYYVNRYDEKLAAAFNRHS